MPLALDCSLPYGTFVFYWIIHGRTMSYSTEDYLAMAYRLILGREPDQPEELKAARPETRQSILRRFLYSPEFRKLEREGILWPRGKQFLTELPNSERYWILTSDDVVSHSIVNNRYEPNETKFVLRNVKQGMHVLDIGANLGWYTIKMSRLVGHEGSVTSFEPRPDLAQMLKKTIVENGAQNVTMHQCALADKNSQTYIAFPPDDPNPAGSAIFDCPPSHYISHVVEMKTLDSIVGDSHVDFIKIDVEGAEPLVFSGGARTLERCRPVILSEINQDCLQRISNMSGAEYAERLRSLGYDVFCIAEDGEIGGPIGHKLPPMMNVVLVPTGRQLFTLSSGRYALYWG
jgi:FkbM family methyltransferase